MKPLERHCLALIEGRTTFTTFFHNTRRTFERLAAYLLRRWPAPAWEGREDLLQELYLGAYRALFGNKPFDPARGVSVARYLVYNAVSYAKRQLHKARGVSVSGSADNRLATFDVPMHGDQFLDLMLTASTTPSPEMLMIAHDERGAAIKTALGVCKSTRERIAIRALDEGGDVDGAASILYEDFPTRITLRLGSEGQAANYVRSAARCVAHRLSDHAND